MEWFYFIAGVFVGGVGLLCVEFFLFMVKRGQQ
jgi:hypothetical protein